MLEPPGETLFSLLQCTQVLLLETHGKGLQANGMYCASVVRRYSVDLQRGTRHLFGRVKSWTAMWIYLEMAHSVEGVQAGAERLIPDQGRCSRVAFMVCCWRSGDLVHHMSD